MMEEFRTSSLQQNSFRDAAPAEVLLEACETYQKQSYRNRCHFYSASGRQSLSFPVVHDKSIHNQLITDVKVDYSKPWLVQHQRAIISAYRTSAFFDYYEDELFAVMDSRPETLWELNKALIRFFIDKIGMKVDLRDTEEYLPPFREGGSDFRSAIHPKRPDDILERLQKNKAYFQVFAQKHGFIPNLSIMDLLFNEGPNAISFL